MTEDVARKLPPFVYREKTRHGRAVYYFRRQRRGTRIRLPDYGTTDFNPAYDRALAGGGVPVRRAPRSGTLAWLIEQYRQAKVYTDLSRATRRQRDNIFRQVVERSGSEPFVSVNERSLHQAIDDRASTPFQAHHFSVAMRGLFRWAKKSGHVETDPTAGVTHPRRPHTEGFEEWTEDDAVAFERRWPLGTKERVWYAVIAYTGFRRGDAVRVGKQHVRNGIISLTPEKTKSKGTVVAIPMLAELAEAIEAGPVGDLQWVVGEKGQPLVKESFGNLFRIACNKAGVRKSAHGLRKLGATRHADAGATERELDAWYGWTGGKTSYIYTRKADRKKAAARLAEKSRNADAPHLEARVPHPKNSSGGSSA